MGAFCRCCGGGRQGERTRRVAHSHIHSLWLVACGPGCSRTHAFVPNERLSAADKINYGHLIEICASTGGRKRAHESQRACEHNAQPHTCVSTHTRTADAAADTRTQAHTGRSAAHTHTQLPNRRPARSNAASSPSQQEREHARTCSSICV